MLNSSSALTEIKAAYVDNASYAEDGSAAKAKAFITACRLLLLYLPKRAGMRGGEELELELQVIKQELDDAKKWLALNDSSASACRVKNLSFENFRS